VDGVILALAILIGLGFYFLPTIIAQIRSTKRAATIFAVNLIFGWTVVGWIAAVIWALGQQPSPEGEPASSCPMEADTWSFDLPKLTERSAIEQGDHWVFGPENFVEPRRNR
jgi:hypothetical protein